MTRQKRREAPASPFRPRNLDSSSISQPYAAPIAPAMCTIESPIALWTGDYKSGRELIVTPEGQAAIHDQLAKKGYVQVMVDANTRQLLQ